MVIVASPSDSINTRSGFDLVSIWLRYATTNTWGNPKWIEIDGVSAADGSGSYSWNTAGVAAGTYYVAGYLYTPSSGAAVFSHLTTSFTVVPAASIPAKASPQAEVVGSSPTIWDLALLQALD